MTSLVTENDDSDDSETSETWNWRNAENNRLIILLFDYDKEQDKRLDKLEERLDALGSPGEEAPTAGGRRTRRRRRKKRTRRRGKSRRKRGAVRTKHNTPKVFDPKTMKVIPNPHFKKPKKPSPITLSVQGQRVTFHPREVEQQRKMLTQLKKLSPTNKGGRRKKSTKRRRKSRRRMRRKRKRKTKRRRRR